eukprot:CAMPEP_0198734956 /NCGR_PEP_ID=MMETSP1475-20131203/56188_1 /TAXON_ID= ORGANISM="Unidentified sp., Strain CCMP1999" /NCGR_SAMPLE_ID=MMETSP1475 /ASSEMBLY_ACC=CAM_ASM_001111 /LENGTH=577 /DNA_ID=CAMNT_0044498527 /DNA_START=336 /DNA_END=2066 /DNA_ORIENTATION=-
MGDDGAGEGEPQLLRVEFLYTSTPVEGCDIMPYVVVRMPNGEVKSTEALEEKSGPLDVQYRWYRCSQKYICANERCKEPAQMQFTTLFKLLPQDAPLSEALSARTFFCSRACFEDSWWKLRSMQLQESKRCPRRWPRARDAESLDLEEFRRLSATGGNRAVKEPEDNPLERNEVGWTKSFTPSTDEVGHVLQVACRYVHRLSSGAVHVGPPLVAQSSPVIEAPPPPPERPMINVYTRKAYSSQIRWTSKNSFRVLTYNCLAEIYANPRHFPHCPAWALAWTYRRRNIVREIEAYASDILCLQEVQADHFESYLQPVLSQLGYDGTFKSKTREAMGKRGKIDGCATFWLRERFQLREQHDVEFNTLAYARGLRDSRGLKLLMKGNVGQLLVLDEVGGSGPIIVANTHIFWDPEKSEVKVFQVDAFLGEIQALLHRTDLQTPVVFGGDLNSAPESAVYELMSTGGLDPSAHDEIGDDTYGILKSCRLGHNLQLRSSYATLGYEPAFTNYTGDFVGTLDYVWYSQNRLLCIAVLELPEEKELQTAIPGASPAPDGAPTTSHLWRSFSACSPCMATLHSSL